MRDSIKVRCCISGTADGRIDKESVMCMYNHLIKIGYNETDSEFYDSLLDWIEADMCIIDTNCDIDECEITEWDREYALDFIKECIEADGFHIDDDGQVHLFDPTEYEVSDWELECRRKDELKNFMQKGE